ncbi:MAG: type IV pilus assembly protein PilM, partial [Gaiellaceae bacterium]
SFRRKPKPDVDPPVPATEPPPVPDEPAARDERASLLKKEISFRRKPKTPAKPKPADVDPPVPATEPPPVPDEPAAKDERASLLKKEISFRRKAKQPKAERPRKQRKEREPKEKQERKQKEPKAATEKAPSRPKEAKLPKEPRAKRRRGTGSQKRLVGLKIGASQIAAARVVNNGAAQLVQIARTDLDPGIVAGGELLDPEALAEALKDFFKTNKLPKRGVRLGIANNRIGVRTFDLGGIDDPKQLANAIRFRAQEALPIPIDEAVLDYQVLSEGVDENGEKTRRILLVVAYRELIDRYVSACRKAGIQLAGIDLEAFALLRALAAPPEGEATPEAAFVAVSIGHDRTTFAVSNGRVCEFTRVLEWGGSTLDAAIARALDITPVEAEAVKRSLPADGEELPEGLSEAAAAKAREAIRTEIQSFARELVSSLQFYQGQPGSLGIGEIAVTGGTAHLHGLAERLQQQIGVGVRVADPLARVRIGKRLKDEEQVGSLAIAIGLGIED